jgi:hypothetical protein
MVALARDGDPMAAQPSATAFPAVPGVPSEVAKLTPDARRAIDELCRKHARLRATLDAARVHDGGGHPDRDAARPRQDDSSEPIGAHSRDVAAENSTAQLRRSRPGGNGEPQLAERDKKPETEERTIVQPQSRLATESSKPNGPQGAAAMESPSATSVDATWHAADVSLEEEAGLPVATVDEGGSGAVRSGSVGGHHAVIPAALAGKPINEATPFGPLLVNYQGAARLLGTTPSALRKRIHRGDVKLTACMVTNGRAVRFSVTKLNERFGGRRP